MIRYAAPHDDTLALQNVGAIRVCSTVVVWVSRASVGSSIAVVVNQDLARHVFAHECDLIALLRAAAVAAAIEARARAIDEIG